MSFDTPLLSLAAVLFSGIVGGELLGRLHLPKVTGWIGTGILLRALELPGLEAGSLGRFSPFTNFVLGYIAFTVGAALHFTSLRNAGKRLALLLMGEALITPALVFIALVFVGGVDKSTAMILAAIAIAGAPGTTVLVVQEARARGILSRTLIAAVGLIDMAAVGGFVFATSIVGAGAQSWPDGLTALATEFGLALAIGAGCAIAAVAFTRRFIGPAFLGPISVALILASWGFGRALEVSSILACTFAGITLSNVRHDSARAAEAYLRPFGGVLFAGFYTFAGMRLDFGLVVPMVGLVLLFVLGRLAGKSLSAYLAMSLSGVTDRVRRYLGLALLPHGGVAVGLVFLVQADPRLEPLASTIATVALAALAINQLLGPSATRFALSRAGEVGKDRPRLLDFLKEQRIVVGLQGMNTRELIETLATRLYATTKMEMPREEFVERVLERESEESTALGLGFMIPHAMIPDGDEVRGVLGLSHEGLDLGAADGRRVHAVVLLAAPENDRPRHLQILAAFASAITSDENLREQLYHARSAAHAYEVLHADESEDLNYFLDEAMVRAGVGGPDDR